MYVRLEGLSLLPRYKLLFLAVDGGTPGVPLQRKRSSLLCLSQTKVATVDNLYITRTATDTTPELQRVPHHGSQLLTRAVPGKYMNLLIGKHSPTTKCLENQILEDSLFKHRPKSTSRHKD